MFILLGLFLGGLGVHNFYAGHNNKGIVQLLVGWFVMSWLGWLTCGAGWVVWWIYLLIDTLITDTDASGRKMT